jgi:hypothetical protein
MEGKAGEVGPKMYTHVRLIIVGPEITCDITESRCIGTDIVKEVCPSFRRRRHSI